MPELPDVTLYVEAIAARLVGRELAAVRVAKPFVVRTFDPPVRALEGAVLARVERLGKRIVLHFESGLCAAIHLMIAGRLRYVPAAGKGARRPTPSAARTRMRMAAPLATRPATDSGLGGPVAGGAALPMFAPLPGKLALVGFDFLARRVPDAGPSAHANPHVAAHDTAATLILTEAGTERRAAVHVFRDRAGLATLDAGGIEPLDATLAAFTAALGRENHTLKRALTDPHLFAGIGNAYSDEILHRARLSPLTWTSRLTADDVARLHAATRAILVDFTERLRHELAAAAEPGGLPAWPDKVTAFRPEMAVHGRYRQPCPVCATPVQRIVRGKHEVNYCPGCQTDGKLLADRALSRLLRGDWPKTLEELDELKRRAQPSAPLPKDA